MRPGIHHIQSDALKMADVLRGERRLSRLCNSRNLNVADFPGPAGALPLRSDAACAICGGEVKRKDPPVEGTFEQPIQGCLQVPPFPSLC